MPVLFIILLTISCVILGLIVLIQNPKGGGLSGTIGGFSNQIMGVKQTTDVLEKGTWIFAAIVGVLCIVSSLFFKGTTTDNGASILQKVNTNSAPAQQQAPAGNTANFPTGKDSTKK